MSTIVLLDGGETVDFGSVERALAYGDGVFETMRAFAGCIPLWHAHMARLERGCECLGFETPPAALLREERDQVLRTQPDTVLKLMVWRRGAAAGYSPEGQTQSHRCWSSRALPKPHVAPLRVRWCDLQLAHQPRLAGIKTLNRLEQVLARSEWSGDEWHEGLLGDVDGNAVSAIAGNLFAVIDGRLVTPALDRCGVAGVMRGWILEQDRSHGTIDVRAILRADIGRASELFLTNAVRGIRAIAAVGPDDYRLGPVTLDWKARARSAGLMDAEEFAD